MLRLETSAKKAVRCVAYSPDGGTLASAGEDRAVKLWALPDGERIRAISVHKSPLYALAFRKDGTVLASGGGGNELQVWSAADGQSLAAPQLTAWQPRYGVEFVTGVAFGGNGDLLVTTRNSVGGGGINGGRLSRLFGPKFVAGKGAGVADVYSSAIHPTGRHVAVAVGGSGSGRHQSDSVVRRMSWATCAVGAGGFTLRSRAMALVFDPSGKRLAAAIGQEVHTWELAKKGAVTELAGHAKQVRGIAFTPDGRYLLSAALDGLVIRWEVATGREVNRFDWELGPLYSIAIAPDGLTAAVAGNGVAVFDLEG